MASIQPINFPTWPWLYWCEQRADATAVVCNDVEVSWQQLCRDISRTQNTLQHHPFQHSDAQHHIERIAIVGDNRYCDLVNMLASWQSGWQTLMVNPAFSPEFQATLLEDIGISHCLSFDDVFTNVDASLPFERHDLRKHDQAPVVSFIPEKCLTLTLTSGSTGLPKAVVHTADNHLSSAAGLFSLMPFNDADCWLLSLPLFHVSGLAIVWRWLLNGAVLKIAETKGDTLIPALDGATHASLVPTQLQRIVSLGKPASLHSVLLGGAAIPQPLVDEAERMGIQCWCGYGMTEMASTISAKRADGRLTVGDVLPNRELQLSEAGEVLVKGRTLAAGYMVKGQVLPLAERWFATKDKARWCSESHELQILGRLDNMFVCGGENVQPEDVERVLGQFDGIQQLFILPVEHARWGQVPVAVVEGKVEHDAFLAWAKQQVPAYQSPQAMVLLPENVGVSGIKLSRKALTQWLALQPLTLPV
ncbi:o-succinylbenzoate--CoA ligase [Enterovibrio baiacu]|uniref:o-succinylbenzoate--CoA ligase n=1 Tax=Enterovibrio baiacu TaxID=2491023 RepID=UPI0010126AE8|nr:o-succinylbenzoate--CoA ligase [Enterovibrio baiacu]MBE1274828.1 o-succinylbenzoate--CoA ligase [Enterovibrio baiacu]